ncbi:MAG: hypothetical protein ACFFD6_05300 [Candidatus Thorarchaeota archaeon]
MESQENLTKETTAVVTYSVVSAVQAAEEYIIDSLGWNAINDTQQEFLDSFYAVCRGEIPNIKELKSIAHTDADFINTWLKTHDFNIQLSPFEENGFGTAGILDIMGLWLIQGQSAIVKTDDDEQYPGVRLGEDGVSLFKVDKRKELVAALKTRNDDMVYMMMADTVPTGLALGQTVQDIMEKMTPTSPKFQGVVFPMIDLNMEGPLDWLLQMQLMIPQGRFPFYFIQQALQQIKLKMNPEGFRVKSATAIAMVLGAAPPKRRPYIIDRPFLMWITRPGLSKPLLVSYLNKDVWKDPSGLEM